MDKSDAKSRMLKHIKNKKKYKSKPVSVPPKAKPVLDSNWDRYEQKEHVQELNSSTDFAILANAPIAQGSHFQFKSDKNISLEEAQKPSELFNLDLTLLEMSLSSIPFHERSGIEEEYFTETQRKIMASTARKNAEDYSTYLKSNYATSNIPDRVFVTESESEISEIANLTDNSVPDKETFVQEPVQCDIESSVEARQDKENDLEQWLDDILDD